MNKSIFKFNGSNELIQKALDRGELEKRDVDFYYYLKRINNKNTLNKITINYHDICKDLDIKENEIQTLIDNLLDEKFISPDFGAKKVEGYFSCILNY